VNKLHEWLDQWDADITSGSQLHADSKIHQTAFLDLHMHLKKVRKHVDEGDLEKSVLWAVEFTRKVHFWEGTIQAPKTAKEVKSTGGKKAAKAKQDKRWPADKRESLWWEYMGKRDKYPSDFKLYEHLAKRALKDKRKWRQIRTQIEKMKNQKKNQN